MTCESCPRQRRATEDQNETHQNWGWQLVIFAHVPQASKSCLGFAVGRVGHWLSWQVLERRQRAQLLTELVLAVLRPECDEEERLLLEVV